MRAAGDLDKSVRGLADEGKAAGWNPSAEPPPGLSWQSTVIQGNEALTVCLHPRRLPLWLYGAIAGMGALAILVGLAQG